MTVLVFVFFIAYEFLVLKPKQIEKMEQQKIEQEQKANAAPEIKEQINSNTSSLAPVVNESKNIVATIKTEKNIIEIDNLGRIYQVTLLEEKYKDDKNNRIKLFAANQLRPLEVRFSNRVLNDEAFKVDVVASSSNIDATTNNQELTLTQTLSGTTLTKKFTFYPDGHYDLSVSSTNNEQFFITNGFRPNVLADMYAVHGFITKMNDNTLRTIEDGKNDKTETIVGSKFVSNVDRYYATVIYNFDKSNQAAAVKVTIDTNNEAAIKAASSSLQ